MSQPNEELQLLPEAKSELSATPAVSQATPITILESAIRGGVTQENVAVVKELVQMVRDQRAEEAKAAFSAAYFKLRKNMPEIHADKQAKDRSGNVVYTYCSEEEIARALEPHLMQYGFAMLFGQSEKDGRITVTVTLIHEQGHQETREYTVRAGSPNAMKDAASCDAGGATTAWRHLMIKMFGLKSRIQEGLDARNEGARISKEKAQYLREQVAETGSNEAKFLELAGVKTYEEITDGSYSVLIRALAAKAKR